MRIVPAASVLLLWLLLLVSTDAVEWRQDHAVPADTFGFVAGAFTTVTQRLNGVTCRYLGSGFSDQEMRRVFGDSARMLAFFAERAGLPYPSATYTQALVARTIGQEMAGLSVVSGDYGRAVLNDPSVSGLLAHELAHQWWGDMVTCHAWTEFTVRAGETHPNGIHNECVGRRYAASVGESGHDMRSA